MSIFNRFTRSELVLYVLLTVLLYLGLNALLPPGILIILLNSLFFGVSIAVVLALTPLIKRALRTSEFDRVSQLTVGIVITWFSIIAVRLNNVLLHSLDKTDWLINSPITSLASYLAIVGGILYVIVPGMLDIRQRANRTALVFSVVIGIILTVFAFILQLRHTT